MMELQDPEIFQTVLDSLHIGVCLVGRDGRILYWNEGAEKITGYRRHEVLGRLCRENGVVITMGALGGPPEEIGHKVAAALVGTFLGILLCYGLVGPLAANMSKASKEEQAYLHVLRVLIFSFLKGTAPILAVEVARRAIPGHVRPSFQELEKACRGGGGESAPPAAAAASAS